MKKKIEIIVPHCDKKKYRLDHILVYMVPNYSRSIFKKSIISQQVYVNFFMINQPHTMVYPGDKITIFMDIKKKKLI